MIFAESVHRHIVKSSHHQIGMNQLIHETSPYLLQHAHNPVDWYPWGEEALKKAREEDKVILVSIGYSACHWCHVMERESFENAEVAGLMNKHFINIKIDREERPDLDHIYMDAVQAMTGSGGWPLNVFLTPQAQPFYGGTYFPPVKAFNRASWTEVLTGVQKAWEQRREEILAQAENLTGHLQQANDFSRLTTGTGTFMNAEMPDLLFNNLMKNADTEWGGFGQAPKFPQTFSIRFLLLYHHFTGSEEALQQATLSINRMLDGGIYDQAGGGLARYSTDTEWKVPHFEKMLYDNALFVDLLADAWRITRNPAYEKAIRGTIGFLQREMLHKDGGFYAALDADSEGEEGKYYIWSKKEIVNLLGDDATLFCTCFDVSTEGNLPHEQPGWAGRNILKKTRPFSQIAEDENISPEELDQRMEICLAKLLEVRQQRVRPGLDDKILLGWNAMMVTALCKAAGALGDSSYAALAERTFNFLADRFCAGNNFPELQHTYKNGKARYPAFLDDYAGMIQAAIQLQEITSQSRYLQIAEQLTRYTETHFSEPGTGYFFFTGDEQQDLVVRKKEVYDGATPSGNALMAANLGYLSLVFDHPGWRERAEQLLFSLGPAVVKYPGSFGVWAGSLLQHFYGWNEVVLTGSDHPRMRDELLKRFIPNRVLQGGIIHEPGFPLLEGKDFSTPVQAYVCRDYSCRPPVSTMPELEVLLAVPGKN